MTIPLIDAANFLQKINVHNNPFADQYYAFYSSWFGGITQDSHLMLLPIDDHMVHRADGVFEGIKAVNRSVYLIEEHLSRLFDSAHKISLNTSFDKKHVRDVILQTLRVANQPNVMIRVFISRGPGNFTLNPYDAVGPQLYVVISELKTPASEKYINGVVIGKSAIPMKSSWMNQVKSCNYLTNVLMKKEAVDRGLDFVIGTDENDLVTEGPAENILIVDHENTIIQPPLENIMKGVTMMRVCELARENGIKTMTRPISIEDLQSAREILITGTTINVLPAIKFENKQIGDGMPGPIAKKMNELLTADINSGARGLSF